MAGRWLALVVVLAGCSTVADDAPTGYRAEATVEVPHLASTTTTQAASTTAAAVATSTWPPPLPTVTTEQPATSTTEPASTTSTAATSTTEAAATTQPATTSTLPPRTTTTWEAPQAGLVALGQPCPTAGALGVTIIPGPPAPITAPCVCRLVDGQLVWQLA